MSFDREIQVLIAGAGIAGLSLAGFFQRIGVQPVLVEATEEFDAHGDVVELPPEATALLEQLGVADEIRDAGAVVTRWARRRPDGTVVNKLDTDDSGGFVAVPYERLREQLVESVGPGSVRTGTALRSVDPSDRPVVVTFENGVRERFDLVIGADGARSRTRESLGGDPPVSCGTTSLAFPLPSSVTLQGASEIWSPDGAVFRAIPAGDRPVGALTVPSEGSGTEEADPAALSDLNTGIDWLLPEALAAVDPDAVWREKDVRVQESVWVEGRVALAGDAAHAPHRLTGIGPILAIEDAAALVSELVDRTDALSAGLAEYAARRRSRLKQLAEPPGKGALRPLLTASSPCPGEGSPIPDIRGSRLATAFGRGTPQPAITTFQSGD